MKRILLTLPLFALACGSAPDRSVETLKKAGFSEIKTLGWAPFNCSDSDSFSTGFKAKNPKGEVVEGVVCCGLIAKACTVRF